MSRSAQAAEDGGIAAWRFRTGIVLIALGGVAYIVASLADSDGLFAAAVGLVAVGLLVHLTDPVVFHVPLTAAALAVAIAGAAVDAVLTAAGSSGPASAAATAALVVGVVVAVLSRRAGFLSR